MQLNRAEIAQRIPHAGAMVLLDGVIESDAEHIVCGANSHRDPHHPLAIGGQLSAVCGIEYAAQAMAVHGSLSAGASLTERPRAGFLASVRSVTLAVARLDDIDAELRVEAHRLSGDDSRVLYDFRIDAAGRPLLSGRAAVVLDADRTFS